ncbi:MAG: hypothetical protein HQL91_03240 [Magnetococcales bacterium]|nr:hypothetical protein [Magnetococcales bacterium]
MNGKRLLAHVDSCQRDCYCDERSRFSVDQNNRNYFLTNNEKRKVCKIQVDGCFSQKNGMRCDYLFFAHDLQLAYLVELKGSDVLYGVKQIATFFDEIKNDLAGCHLHARIVSGRCNIPDIRSTDYRKLERRMMETGGSLRCKTKQDSDDIP